MRALRTVVVLALSSCLALGASPVIAAEDSWDVPPVSVVDAGADRPVKLVTVGSRVVAAWISGGGFGSAYSDDGGATWSTPQHVDYGGLLTGDGPELVVSGSSVTVVQVAWNPDNGDMFVLATTSVDGGDTWGAVQVAGTGDWEESPRTAWDGSHTAIAWLHNTPSGRVVGFTTAVGGGPGWSSVLDLSGPASFVDLDLAADGGRVGVVWQEWTGGVKFRSSTDGGATWTPALTDAPTPVSGPTVGGPARLQLLMHDGLITVAWFADYGLGKFVWSSSSADGGATWSTPVQHSDTTTTSSELHLIATGAGVALAWSHGQPNVSGGGVIRVTTSSDGITWTTPTDLSGPGSSGPQLAAFEGNLVAAWMADDPGGVSHPGFVTARISTDGGLSWGDSVDLGIPTLSAFTPALTVVDRTVVLASRDRQIPGSVLASAYTFSEPPPPPPPAGGLAATGLDAALSIWFATGLLCLGVITLAATRRIRPVLEQREAPRRPALR